METRLTFRLRWHSQPPIQKISTRYNYLSVESSPSVFFITIFFINFFFYLLNFIEESSKRFYFFFFKSNYSRCLTPNSMSHAQILKRLLEDSFSDSLRIHTKKYLVNAWRFFFFLNDSHCLTSANYKSLDVFFLLEDYLWTWRGFSVPPNQETLSGFLRDVASQSDLSGYKCPFQDSFFFAGILKEYGILPPKAKVLHGQKLDSIVFMPVNRQRNTSWITNNKSIE